MNRRSRLFPLLAFVAVLSASVPLRAAAEIDQSDVMTARLLPGWQLDNGHHMAALDITLAPEWKTYWRSPGDAGIPPQFDWSGSTNLASVRYHWPRPSAFTVNGMSSIGYHDRLLLPIEVAPRDPSKPVRLEARIDLGICRKICLPAQLDLGLTLDGSGQPDAAIRAALEDGPDSAAAAGVGSVRCAVSPIVDGLRVTATVEMPSLGAPETLVFEPGQPRIWVAQAVTSRSGGRLTATTDMVAPSGAPFALDRSALVLTVLGPGRAVEITGCPGE